MERLAKHLVVMLLAFALTLVSSAGCVSELDNTTTDSTHSKVVVPHYRITRDIKEPTIDEQGRTTYRHWLIYELDNGAWYRTSVVGDPLTPEMIDGAVTRHFESMLKFKKGTE